jgi:hypothetical protein
VFVAPIARRPVGRRIVDLIAQRPATWGSVRRLAAACLLAVVLASSLARDAAAATNLGPGTDPSVSGTTVVWTSPSGGVAQQEDTTDVRTVPPHAAVGGDLIAWRDGDTVHVARLADLAPVLDVTVSGVTAVAVSGTWLVTRARSTGRDVLTARRLDAPDAVQTVSATAAPAQLGRPALDGDVLAYHVAARRLSTIVVYNLATATRRVVRRSRSNLLTNPSLLGGELLYDRQTSLGQLVVLGSLDRAVTDRVVYRLGPSATRDAGHQRGYSRHTRTPHPRPAKWRLWTTALSAQHVYVTLLPRFGAPSSARLVSLSR